MKILGAGSLSSLLESTLTVFWVISWLCVLAFIVIPSPDVASTSLVFPVKLSHGPSQETTGPGGTWTLTTEVASVSAPLGSSWHGSLIAVPLFVLIAFVFGQLRAIFRSLREGSPFIRENARRLRRVGVALLCFEGVRFIVVLAVVAPAIEKLRPIAGGHGIQASTWPDLGILFLGFSVLVLAEVFRRGTQMQDEQSLTV